MACPTCGTENRPGRKFCIECGSAQSSACPGCGSALEVGAKFCGECGVPTIPSGRPSAPTVVPSTAPTAERRLVSILFADLVGFTPFAEGRDAEDVRDTLTRYFELATEVVARYGGTIEKFIGDAVMAVWGAPSAREDDAERAVRAALDLVDAVSILGPGIQARAGVLTGEAAVTLGATNQGMVAGDLVNTASRLQSAATPGTVLVGEATHRASSDAIVFDRAHDQALKGKTSPVPAWRAIRVVAERGGRNRSESLEAPFVGRADELRLLKDLFHATGRERRARLVSVMGPAGIGKTRLAWEFLKYMDGLVEDVWWHDGRSPAYGDSITFWALGEMVRGRCGLLETDDEPTTRTRVAETVAKHVPDVDERRWIEPALLTLLGIGSGRGSEELFAAWRTFFERLAGSSPVVMVFEDHHYADSGLLDFVDHVLEWSRSVPIYVVTLARPELLEKRPDWGAGKRNFTSIYLEPLPEAAMRALLEGLVPGLPEPAVRAIVGRADGIPLYAVETVRMLLSEGRLTLADGVFRPTGDLADLAVPETLTALIASRLDGLEPADRKLVCDAATLGQSFTLSGLAAVSGVEPAELESRLEGLVRRELFIQERDMRSSERGQYAFVQALIREVAYRTLARKDRKTRHLAAARYFEALGSDELAGALAGHYLAAQANAGEGPEADALAGQARIALRAAAERASSLGAHGQAVTFLEQAMTVTTSTSERAATWLQIAGEAEAAADFASAERNYLAAITWYREQGATEAAMTASSDLGRLLVSWGRVEPGLVLLEEALAIGGGSDAAKAGLWAQLARGRMLHNEGEQAIADADRALLAAGKADLVPIIADVLITKGTALTETVRFREGVALLYGAHSLAAANGLTRTELRAINNLAISLYFDAPDESLSLLAGGIDRARRIGDRGWLAQLGRLFSELSGGTGEWDRGLAIIAEIEHGEVPDEIAIHFSQVKAEIAAKRGHPAEAEALLNGVDDMLEQITNPFQRAYHLFVRSMVALVDDRLNEAFEVAIAAAGTSVEMMQRSTELAGFIAVCRRDPTGLREATALFDRVGPRATSGSATRRTLAAAEAALDGRRAEALELYRGALSTWRDLRLTWFEALCAIEMAMLLGSAEPEVLAAASRARDILVGLGATPFIERLDSSLAEHTAMPVSPSSGASARE